MWAACNRGEREAPPLTWRKVSAEATGLGSAAPNAASACGVKTYHLARSPWSQV